MATVFAIFTALANVKAIAGYIEQFASLITGWYIQKQSQQTLADIADAASLTANAKTDAERFAAADAWAKALSRTRIINS